MPNAHATRAGSYQPISSLRPRDLAYALSPAECRDFHTRGFIIIRNRFSADEVQAFRDEADRLVATADSDHHNLRYWNPGETDEVTPWKVDPCVDVSAVMARVARDRRITDAIASLFGGYPPRLFKDKLIIKPAGSKGNGLHQDYNWWQGFPGSLLSVSLALDSTTRANGCTQMWTGFQQGFLHQTGTQDGAIDPAALESEERHYVELAPGDMAIFHCLTPHAADTNSSDSARRVLFLSYNDSRDGEHYEQHYEHFFAYMCKQMDPKTRAAYYWA